MTIKQNILDIKENISRAISKREGNIEEVKIVAATKSQSVAAMLEAAGLGIEIIGENKVQEALEKYQVINKESKTVLKWHLIGHLQTNKVRQAVETFDLIQSVDSERLALFINKAAEKMDKRQDVLIQINVGGEDSKYGIEPDLKELIKIASGISNLKNLRLRGLMTVAPFFPDAEEVRPVFRKLKSLFDELKGLNMPNVQLDCLSMGMTHDYIAAIEEGANIVRIGTGIFGARD